MSSRSVRARVAVVVLLLLGPRVAYAQEPTGETFAPAPSADEEAQRARSARQHFLAGLEHYEAGRYREAIGEFEEASRLVPSADLWFNIARAREQLQEFGPAAESYRRYLRDRVEAPDTEAVEARIARLEAAAEAQRRAALTPASGTLLVRADRAGASVRLDGAATATTPVSAPLAVTPARHELDVAQEGRIPFRAAVQVEPGVTTEAHVTLAPATEYRTVGRRRLATWILASAVVGSVGTAIGLGAHAVKVRDGGDLESARDWARYSDYATAGAITFGVGATVAFFLEGRATRTERVDAGSDE